MPTGALAFSADPVDIRATISMPSEQILVLGDLQADWLTYEKRVAVADDSQAIGLSQHFAPPMTMHHLFGGAYFVAVAIEGALAAAKQRRVRVSSYDVGNLPVGYDPPSVMWDFHSVEGSGALRLQNPRRLVTVDSDLTADHSKRDADPRTLPRAPLPTLSSPPAVFVVDDLGLAYRDIISPPSLRAIRNPTKNALRNAYTELQDMWEVGMGANILVCALGSQLPDFKSKTIWSDFQSRKTKGNRPPHSVVVLNAHDLRESGVPISTGLSWERTAEDVMLALNSHPDFRQLEMFDHVIVRLGITGAVYATREAEESSGIVWRGWVYFDPERSDSDYEDPQSHGTVIGYNSVFIATVVQEFASKGLLKASDCTPEKVLRAIRRALPEAVRRCVERFILGYGKEWKDVAEHKYLTATFFSTPQDARWIGEAHIPSNPSVGWSILNNCCGKNRTRPLAKKLVIKGIPSVFQAAVATDNGTLNAPIAVFEKACFVDRLEIESYRTLRNLIERHLRLIRRKDRRGLRPLSIGVFGPPGSGKSFGVKNVVNSVADPSKTNFLTFNMTQCNGVAGLDAAFKKIVDTIATRKVPIVFFDEFDAAVETPGDLGWLKYFLSPMEDGEYGQSPVGDAIFVFAGGTSTRYTDFAREDVADTSKISQFIAAKGPDFVSRLNGHVDILGINPRGTDDKLHLIRRAIVMRNEIARIQGLDATDKASIDDDLANALLLVSKYKHGARSLRAILELCANKWGHIRESSLPTASQLKMHLDAEAFIKILDDQASRFADEPT